MEVRKSRAFQPVYDKKSKILILGTAPSIKSCESGFYYGHPQNRFWKVIAGLCQSGIPETVKQKKELLLNNGIALWDVIDTCEIIGSADSSIKNIVVNDFSKVLRESQIEAIYANGTKALQIYEKYVEKETKIKIAGLPSTSPLNARYSFDMLFQAWEKELSKYIK